MTARVKKSVFEEIKGSPCGGTNVGKLNFKHGRYDTRLYRIWANMRARCNNPNHRKYKDYGGRGIRVCDRWSDFTLFAKDMGERPSDKHELDRKNRNGHYEPGNVQWATRKHQMRNTSRTRMLTLNGLTFCATEWAERLGVSKHTLASRLKLGWSDERVLTTPFRRATPLQS